jgi:hypothetical protein
MGFVMLPSLFEQAAWTRRPESAWLREKPPSATSLAFPGLFQVFRATKDQENGASSRA